MKSCLLFLLMLCAVPIQAQTHYTIGLQNTGPLATEVTQHVRNSSLPGALYLGIGNDSKMSAHFRLTTRGTVMISSLQDEPCAETPCEKIPRYNYRPRSGANLDETPFWFIDTGIGVRYISPYGVELAAGPAFDFVVGNYSRLGATPMLVGGAFAETRAEAKVFGLKLGLEAGVTVIPPQSRRFTVLSYWSGYKKEGEPWSNGHGDPLTMTVTRLGIVVER